MTTRFIPSKTHYTLSAVEDLQNLKTPWRNLQTRFDTPLLTFEWFESAAESFSHPDDLDVHVIQQDGVVTAIAPLHRKDHVPTRSELIGSSVLREQGGMIYELVYCLRISCIAL